MDIDPLDAPAAAVIGTGRCGTGYIAELLARGGLNVGHERFWCAGVQPPVPGLEVDVSWLALPDIEAGNWSGPVVHITRDPVAVVRSLVRTGFFGPIATPLQAFAYLHCPAVRGLDVVEAAVAWWCDWNTRCARVATTTIPIEAFPLQDALDALGLALGVAIDTGLAEAIPRDVNRTPRGWSPVLEDDRHVPAADVWRLIGAREAFGYVQDGARA
jgi:hypothetical protein